MSLTKSGDGRDRPNKLGWAVTDWLTLAFPRTPTTVVDGHTCSTNCRRLNPLFVEWLMGWPTGWSDYEYSATALYHWKRHMRWLLSMLLT